jgi:hypothetical protein
MSLDIAGQDGVAPEGWTMRSILLIGALLVPALMLGGCASPEARTRDGLISAGIDRQTAGCMANRMVHRLSLLQLRRLSGIGKAEGSRDLDQLLYRLRALNDDQIVGVTASSAALCATGLLR